MSIFTFYLVRRTVDARALAQPRLHQGSLAFPHTHIPSVSSGIVIQRSSGRVAAAVITARDDDFITLHFWSFGSHLFVAEESRFHMKISSDDVIFQFGVLVERRNVRWIESLLRGGITHFDFLRVDDFIVQSLRPHSAHIFFNYAVGRHT